MEKQYYIQSGWSGNAMLWWREGGEGYTDDISEAGRLVKKRCRESSITDPTKTRLGIVIILTIHQTSRKPLSVADKLITATESKENVLDL